MEPVVAYLLNYAPRARGTRDDMLLGLVTRLRQRGVVPICVFSQKISDEMLKLYGTAGAEVEAINFGNGFLHYYQSLRALQRKYSIRLAHVRFFRFSDAIPWVARAAGLSQIAYTDAESGLLTPVPWKKKILKVRGRWLAAPVRRFVAISQFIRSRLIELGIPAERIEVVYNGVDPKRFFPNPLERSQFVQQFSLRPEEVILTTISFLNPLKNPSVLLDACLLLHQRGIPFRLFIAGEGLLRHSLEERISRCGLADRVHMLGHVADPRSLFQASDVFLLGSVGEAFGLVLVEAMACGAPIVSTLSGGIPEVVEDGVTGRLVPPHDAAGMADAIQNLAENPALREEMGRKGRLRVEELFSIDTFVEKTIRAYEGMAV